MGTAFSNPRFSVVQNVAQCRVNPAETYRNSTGTPRELCGNSAGTLRELYGKRKEKEKKRGGIR